MGERSRRLLILL